MEIFQISSRRFVAISKIPGSPARLLYECYKEPEAPSGWYLEGAPHYILGASTNQEAAQLYTQELRSKLA